MKRVLQTLAGLGVTGVLGAIAVVGFGLYDIAARAGHWPGVGWVLHTTYQNSVARQADATLPMPSLDDADAIALGARHFDQACRVCHGAPGSARSTTVLSMAPRPPHVTRAVEGWEAHELHWILYEGVKMSGMPHWPSTRRDDVWPVVAFLNAVASMDGAAYDRMIDPLARGGPAGSDGPAGGRALTVAGVEPTVVARCASCHGEDGRSFGNTHVPRLDLQRAAYLAASLRTYRDGRRASGIMRHAASVLDDREIDTLAMWYGEKPVNVSDEDRVNEPASAAHRELIARGKTIATGGENPEAIPNCQSCHGPWPHPITNAFPAILGQHEDYLRTQLTLWRDGERGGTTRAATMHRAATALDDSQIRALAAFYAAESPRKQDAPDEIAPRARNGSDR